jgi:hypothetical protein
VYFEDPGSFGSETYACTFDFGDGGGPVAGSISGIVCTAPDHSYATKGTYTMVATVTDSHGAAGTYAATTVIVNPTPIVGPVSAPASVISGTSVSASATYVSTGMDPADTCTVDYGDGSGPLAGIANGTTCTGPSHKYAVLGTFTIVVEIKATNGATASSSASIKVISLQVGVVSVTGRLLEGSSVVASAGFTPVGSQTYKCKVDYGDGSGALTGTISGTTCKGPSHKYGRPGSFSIAVTVTGSKGNTGASTLTVDVANVMPTITSFTMSPTVGKTGSTVKVSLAFSDPGTTETYRAVLDWGDGNMTIVDMGPSARTLTSSHVYATAGLYPVYVNLTDWTVWVTGSSGVLPIYDPNRVLSGSGSFASVAGACQLSPKCGIASTGIFSVSARYARGASTPTVSFSYSAAAFAVNATSADWFVAANGIGTINGNATVNGASGYRFEAVATDGDPDFIFLQVWNKAGVLVYENGAPLKPGAVTIK